MGFFVYLFNSSRCNIRYCQVSIILFNSNNETRFSLVFWVTFYLLDVPQVRPRALVCGCSRCFTVSPRAQHKGERRCSCLCSARAVQLQLWCDICTLFHYLNYFTHLLLGLHQRLRTDSLSRLHFLWLQHTVDRVDPRRLLTLTDRHSTLNFSSLVHTGSCRVSP